MKWNVTITGADDRVAPEALADLSEEFPRVEWGILCSESREGQPRYPSRAWTQRLVSVAERQPMRLSAHLCGALAHRVGNAHAFPLLPMAFQRVQLNGFCTDWTLGFASPRTFILQVRSEQDLQAAANYAASLRMVKTVLLFDPSGGRGRLPFSWPSVPCGVQLGYAGGIGPDNVADVLCDLVALFCATGGSVDETWIDMESGVRDESDAFDLGRVRRVLEQIP